MNPNPHPFQPFALPTFARRAFLPSMVAAAFVILFGGCARPRPPLQDAESRARQLVAEESKGVFQMTSFVKQSEVVDVERGMATITFRGKAELVRDACSRGPTTLTIAEYPEKPETARPAERHLPIVYQVFRKGAVVNFEGTISWERNDDRWREVQPTDIITDGQSVEGSEFVIQVIKKDSVKEYRSPHPYLDVPAPSEASILEQINAELPNRGLGCFKATDLKIVSASDPHPPGSGEDYRQIKVSYRCVFVKPTVYMLQFRDAPVVGAEPTFNASAYDMQFIQYFDVGDSIPFSAVAHVSRNWCSDEWRIDPVYEGQVIDSDKSVRMTYTTNAAGKTIYKTVEVVKATWHPNRS